MSGMLSSKAFVICCCIASLVIGGLGGCASVYVDVRVVDANGIPVQGVKVTADSSGRFADVLFLGRGSGWTDSQGEVSIGIERKGQPYGVAVQYGPGYGWAAHSMFHYGETLTEYQDRWDSDLIPREWTRMQSRPKSNLLRPSSPVDPGEEPEIWMRVRDVN